MAKYRTRRPWLQTIKPEDGSKPTVILHEAGAKVDYDGLPGDNLEPLDGTARKRCKEAAEEQSRIRREADLKASKEGRSILAALVNALGGSGKKVDFSEADELERRGVPEYDTSEGPKVKAPSPAKVGGHP